MRTLVPTAHALQVILEKGFDPDTVRAVFEAPEHTTVVKKKPHQTRLIGQCLVLVGEWCGGIGNIFELITVYTDTTLTPPRPDQLDTPEGRRYAARYAAGLGRG